MYSIKKDDERRPSQEKHWKNCSEPMRKRVRVGGVGSLGGGLTVCT